MRISVSLVKYRELDSLIHNLNPKVKIISLLLFILSVILNHPYSSINLIWYFILILTLIFLSKIPMMFFLKNAMAVIPFIAIMGIFIPIFTKGESVQEFALGPLMITISDKGILLYINILFKSYLCFTTVLLLITTTKPTDLFWAFGRLKVPSIFIMILVLMYRYISLIREDLTKTKQAMQSRTIKCPVWYRIKTLANMLGTLFFRTYEKAETVYYAMTVRGFNGYAKTMNISERVRKIDLCFLFVIIILLGFINII